MAAVPSSASRFDAEDPKESNFRSPTESDPLMCKAEEPGCLAAPGAFLEELADSFGWKLLVFLVAAQHIVKGFVHDARGQLEPYVYRAYNVPAPQMQIFTGVTAVPWSMKPFIGLLSDVCPIGGYSRGPYLAIVTCLAILAYLCVGIVPTHALVVIGVVICFLLIDFQESTVDLLSEAMYAESIQTKCPSKGPDLLTFVWFGMQFMSLFGVGLAGLAVSYLGAKIPYLILLPGAACILGPIALGYLEEVRKTPEEVRQARGRLMQHPELCMLCCVTFVGTLVLTFVGICFASPRLNCIVGVLIAILMAVSCGLVLSPMIARFAIYTLIQASLSLEISGASFYFYTDTAEQYPEGPHFTALFYNSVIGMVGSAFSLLGIWSYQRYMKSWRYRHVLLATNVINCLLNFLDTLFFARVNLKLGIPDHAFVLGSSVLQKTVFQWKWMPSVVILSYLCPPGMEATMYALLAGCHNVGNPISSSCGAYLLELLGCRPSGVANESAQFENLWIASAIATALPLIVIVALFALIPDARQDERLIANVGFDGTEGSLLRRWTGRDTTRDRDA